MHVLSHILYHNHKGVKIAIMCMTYNLLEVLWAHLRMLCRKTYVTKTVKVLCLHMVSRCESRSQWLSVKEIVL